MSNESTYKLTLGGGPIFLIFLILKLTDTVDWSWWWVTAPLWLPIVFILGLALIFSLIVNLFFR